MALTILDALREMDEEDLARVASLVAHPVGSDRWELFISFGGSDAQDDGEEGEDDEGDEIAGIQFRLGDMPETELARQLEDVCNSDLFHRAVPVSGGWWMTEFVPRQDYVVIVRP